MAAIISIAGSGRGAGKTAVGCALIEALPEFRWTAVKATPHRHADESEAGDAALPVPVEEFEHDSDKDTSRYVAAGAERAWLVVGEGRTLQEKLGEVLARGEAQNSAVLVEGGSTFDEMPGTRSHLRLLVLSGEPGGWKPGTRGRIAEADLIVCQDSLGSSQVIRELSPVSQTKLFAVPSGRWVTDRLVELVRSFLEGGDAN